MRQTKFLKIINDFVNSDIQGCISLQEYCQEATTVEKLLSEEKCIQTPHVIKALEVSKVRERLQSKRNLILNHLEHRLVEGIRSDNSFTRMAETEDVFLCYLNLNSIDRFEEALAEEILKSIVGRTIDQQDLPSILNGLSQLMAGELQWVTELMGLTTESQLAELLCTCMASGILKGVFSKTEYFPIANLEIFAENYQTYYAWVERTFKDHPIPERIKSHLRKKENLLYKAYVVSVIKRLEGSLILLSNYLSTATSPEAVEEYCMKKHKKSFLAAISDLLLRNINSDTVTTSLLHRVFSLGLRTVIRIHDFFSKAFEKTTDASIKSFLAKTSIQLIINVEAKVYTNIEEIGLKLEIDSQHVEKTKTIFGLRLSELREWGLGRLFFLEEGKSLNLEDEIAGIALKLSMQMAEPQQASHLVNTVKLALDKFISKNHFPKVDNYLVKEAISKYSSELMNNYYDKQIEDYQKANEINKRLSTTKDKGTGVALDSLLQNQRELDTSSLKNLEL